MKKILAVIASIIVLFFVWKLAAPLFFNSQVNESLPEEFSLSTPEEFAEMTPEMKQQEEIRRVEAFKDLGETVMEDMVDTEPQVVSFGDFVGIDDFHQGSGIAKIFKGDSSQLLRFENFFVTNGPDLRVLLSKNIKPTSSDDLGDYIELGKLKGNVGNQNYDIPDSVDVSQYKSVVIYCKPFRIIFSVASI